MDSPLESVRLHGYGVRTDRQRRKEVIAGRIGVELLLNVGANLGINIFG